MRKYKHWKIKNVLNISREVEIHAVPKAWNEWVTMAQEKYDKK